MLGHIRSVSVLIVAFVAASIALGEETSPKGPGALESLYPGLATSVLTHAKVGDLPEGLLLRSDPVQIGKADLTKIISGEPPELREQLRKNAFFLLENETAKRLLAATARRTLEQDGQDPKDKGDAEVIRAYLDRLTKSIDVTDQDIVGFYDRNVHLFCGAGLDQVRPHLRQYVLQEKRQEAVEEHIRGLGGKFNIVVSAPWAKEQATLARNNPLDEARGKGRPAIVAFSGASCCGPDKMLPVLKALRQKYEDQVNVVYLEARQEQVLAARYHVRSIPTLILYDKAGKEAFRTTGAMDAEALESKLAMVGVK